MSDTTTPETDTTQKLWKTQIRTDSEIWDFARDLERRLTAALTTNAGLLAAQKEAIDAMDDVLTSTVDASTYPDGPCIEKEFRDALRQAMKRLQAIHLSLAVEQLSGADRNLPGTTEVKQPQREPTYGPPPKGLWEREAAEAEAVKKFFK